MRTEQHIDLSINSIQMEIAPALSGGVINGRNCSANPLIATVLNRIIYHSSSQTQPAS